MNPQRGSPTTTLTHLMTVLGRAVLYPQGDHARTTTIVRETGANARSLSAEINQMTFRSWPFGRLQRAARALLDLEPVTTTKAVMDWAYPNRGTRHQRIARADNARRACVSLGLIKVGRAWPDGNIWAYPKPKDLIVLWEAR